MISIIVLFSNTYRRMRGMVMRWGVIPRQRSLCVCAGFFDQRPCRLIVSCELIKNTIINNLPLISFIFTSVLRIFIYRKSFPDYKSITVQIYNFKWMHFARYYIFYKINKLALRLPCISICYLYPYLFNRAIYCSERAHLALIHANWPGICWQSLVIWNIMSTPYS